MFADDVAVVVVVQTSNLALLLLTVVLLLRISNECELDGDDKKRKYRNTDTFFEWKCSDCVSDIQSHLLFNEKLTKGHSHYPTNTRNDSRRHNGPDSRLYVSKEK